MNEGRLTLQQYIHTYNIRKKLQRKQRSKSPKDQPAYVQNSKDHRSYMFDKMDKKLQETKQKLFQAIMNQSIAKEKIFYYLSKQMDSMVIMIKDEINAMYKDVYLHYIVQNEGHPSQINQNTMQFLQRKIEKSTEAKKWANVNQKFKNKMKQQNKQQDLVKMLMGMSMESSQESKIAVSPQTPKVQVKNAITDKSNKSNAPLMSLFSAMMGTPSTAPQMNSVKSSPPINKPAQSQNKVKTAVQNNKKSLPLNSQPTSSDKKLKPSPLKVQSPSPQTLSPPSPQNKMSSPQPNKLTSPQNNNLAPPQHNRLNSLPNTNFAPPQPNKLNSPQNNRIVSPPNIKLTPPPTPRNPPAVLQNIKQISPNKNTKTPPDSNVQSEPGSALLPRTNNKVQPLRNSRLIISPENKPPTNDKHTIKQQATHLSPPALSKKIQSPSNQLLLKLQSKQHGSKEKKSAAKANQPPQYGATLTVQPINQGRKGGSFLQSILSLGIVSEPSSVPEKAPIVRIQETDQEYVETPAARPKQQQIQIQVFEPIASARPQPKSPNTNQNPMKTSKSKKPFK